jgi:hypothetical protein
VGERQATASSLKYVPPPNTASTAFSKQRMSVFGQRPLNLALYLAEDQSNSPF